MEKTKAGTLFWVAAIAVPIGWTISLVVDSVTYALPPVPWVLPALLLVLAVIMEVARRTVKAWVEHRRFDEQLDALRVARLLVLARASAAFGAALVGAYVGLEIHAVQAWEVPMGRDRTLMAGIVIVAGVALTVTAMRCESACIVPPPDDNTE